MSCILGTALFAQILATPAGARGAQMIDATTWTEALTPQPQELARQEGSLRLKGARFAAALPAGPQHDACREVVASALQAAGVEATATSTATGDAFAVGRPPELPDLPERGPSPEEAYVLAVGPEGLAARGASPAGLLHAAQTLRQLLRVSAPAGSLPCLRIADWPAFELRGIYIEGGQERFGRIVEAGYLGEQIRRLSEFRMNALVIECYNLFPYPSFPECADEGTLSPEECREIVAESRKWHVTLIPSLQTLAQAWELVWQAEAGAPYREEPAPGLICPSNPDAYPFIEGLYRDLLTLFGDSPLVGIGCSEIDMQWRERYCAKCAARIAEGETVRDLLLGHAEQCVAAVDRLSAELGRPIRPLMWGDEFYMYGPGRDWVGLDRIPRHTVMGHWKYWPDYNGIEGLFARGYDVLGISAMYNHCFYLADLSPADPPKSWPSMEQTGVTNIAGMLQAAQAAGETHPDRRFLGVATASFSKHRLRAFDSIWYGFALNGHCGWRPPDRTVGEYPSAFTRAFVRHYYDAQTETAAAALAGAYERLDRAKSSLELTNQTLHDVVGVYDTQEAGYLDNSLAGALRACGKLVQPDGTLSPELLAIRDRAEAVETEATAIQSLLEAQRVHVGAVRELGQLWLAAEQIAAHAARQRLMIDTQVALVDRPTRETRAGLASRWSAHRARLERIERRLAPLYSRGDPCGVQSLLADVRAFETHLTTRPTLAAEVTAAVLEEPFESLDPARWIVRGEPQAVAGRLETRAPGGWENYCGITTQAPVPLLDDPPLIVEFEFAPLAMGIDSPLFGSGTPAGDLAYSFCVAGSGTRLRLSTQCSTPLRGPWQNAEAGWRVRAGSPPLAAEATYRLRASVTRRSFRVLLWESAQAEWDIPLWDSLPVPMDPLDEARLLFADVEPPGATAATRWGPITISRAAAQEPGSPAGN